MCICLDNMKLDSYRFIRKQKYFNISSGIQ